MNAIRLLAAIILSGSGAAAGAAPVMFWSMTDTGPYSHVIDFESTGPLANDTPITTQFQAEGAAFTGSLRANSCGYDSGSAHQHGMPGNTLNTSSPACDINFVADNFALKFSADVFRVAVDAYLYDVGIDTIALFNDGLLVASFLPMGINYVDLAANAYITTSTRTFVNRADTRAGILNVEANGALFDEIRFTERLATIGTYIIFDNLRFDAAAAPTAVPEPGTLALVFAGLLGAGLTRRRARPSSK